MLKGASYATSRKCKKTYRKKDWVLRRLTMTCSSGRRLFSAQMTLYGKGASSSCTWSSAKITQTSRQKWNFLRKCSIQTSTTTAASVWTSSHTCGRLSTTLQASLLPFKAFSLIQTLIHLLTMKLRRCTGPTTRSTNYVSSKSWNRANSTEMATWK